MWQNFLTVAMVNANNKQRKTSQHRTSCRALWNRMGMIFSHTMSVPARDMADLEVDTMELDKILHLETEYMSRATDTIKAAFLIFREATWHTHILNIKCNQKENIIVDDAKKTGRQQRWFVPFPDHLTPTTRDKAAVLSNMACHDIGYLRKLIEQILEGTILASYYGSLLIS